MPSLRRFKVLARNLLDIPWKYKHGISLSAVLQNSTVEDHVRIYPKAKFYRSSLGKYSYIGASSFISDTDIGKFCSISENCYVGGAAHPLDWVSTSLRFYCSNEKEEGKTSAINPFYKAYYPPFLKTYIGNDVWIGAKALILSGVTISDGAVIGAGSVITKDIGPYEIWAGNPAKLIRKRFDDEEIEKLLSLRWWDWTEDRLKKESVFFKDVEIFMERNV